MNAEDDFRGLTVAVIGLGLIGGSLARELAARGARVLGADARQASEDAALAAGVLDARCDCGRASAAGSRTPVEDADIVVLALPVDAAVAALRALAPRLGAARLITDVGSTKRSIVATATALDLDDRFVGAHPLAGDHRSGWAASRTGLFTDAAVYLTPTAGTAAAALALAARLWTALGAQPRQLDAAAHDRLLAWTSHLPQAASSALGATLGDAGISRAQLGRGGHDAARLAASAPDVWTAIALDNAAELAVAIAALERRLAGLRSALEQADEARVREHFTRAAAWASA